jgi:hypothetical protein
MFKIVTTGIDTLSKQLNLGAIYRLQCLKWYSSICCDNALLHLFWCSWRFSINFVLYCLPNKYVTGLNLTKVGAISQAHRIRANDQETVHEVLISLRMHNLGRNRRVWTTLSHEFTTVNFLGREEEPLIKKIDWYLRSANDPSVKYGPVIRSPDVHPSIYIDDWLDHHL